MDKILFLVLAFAHAFGLPKKETIINEKQSALDSARNARYYFSTDIDDEISEVKSHRKELRFGVEVVGSFAYSDGFVYREVVYAADGNGYRIISDKMEHIPQPPQEKEISNSTSASKASTFKLPNSTLHRLPHSNKTKS